MTERDICLNVSRITVLGVLSSSECFYMVVIKRCDDANFGNRVHHHQMCVTVYLNKPFYYYMIIT